MPTRRAKALTEIELRNLKPPADRAQFEVADGVVPGLSVRISKGGTKAFRLYYRVHGEMAQRKKVLDIGTFPELTLKHARNEAQEARSKAAKGIDPLVELRATKVTGNDTYLAVVDRFLALHCANNNKPSTVLETTRHLKKTFGAKWKTRDIRTITTSDIVSVLDGIVARGKKDQQPLAAIRKFFNWCVERHLLASSPCAGLKAQNTTDIRERVLTETELAAVWIAATKAGFPIGPIVKLLILTAQRREEVGGMRWDEIDEAQALWTIPYERTKKQRKSKRPKHPQLVPLSPQALTVIKSAPRANDTFVFPAGSSATATASISGWSDFKERLNALCGIADWTLHDLRRTATTMMPDLNIAEEVLSKVLNHAPVGVTGIVYNKNRYLKQRRDALEAWGAFVEGLAIK